MNATILSLSVFDYFVERAKTLIMDNIIRKIQELYPVSDDSLHLLKYCFKQQTFSAKTIIIQAGRFDNQVLFYRKRYNTFIYPA